LGYSSQELMHLHECHIKLQEFYILNQTLDLPIHFIFVIYPRSKCGARIPFSNFRATIAGIGAS
jgi:hypothetical protein